MLVCGVSGCSHMAPQCFWFSWGHHTFLHIQSQLPPSFMTAFLVHGVNTQASSQGPSCARADWFLACAHMSLLFSSQQQSSFLLNYQCTVSSLIISFFQTCYGLIFLRREAPKTDEGLEGHWERVQLICPHDSSGGAWEMRCGEKIERKATLIFGHQPFSLFSMKLVLLSAFPALLKLSRCGTL